MERQTEGKMSQTDNWKKNPKTKRFDKQIETRVVLIFSNKKKTSGETFLNHQTCPKLN